MTVAVTTSNDWVSALDDLDAFIARAENAIAVNPGTLIEPWLPPTDLGAMPAEFVDRAERLLVRQESLQARLEDASTSVLSARALTQVVAGSSSPRPPSFVDERA